VQDEAGRQWRNNARVPVVIGHMRKLVIGSALIAALLGGAATCAFGATVGDAAPSFSLPTASGEAVALDTLRGKVVYVDFWASWCGPCRRSFPWMSEMHDKYAAQGLAIVAINVDRNLVDAERFLRQFPQATFAVVFDPVGATPAAYAVRAMPSSFLIDARGAIVQVEPGFRDEQKATLEARIRTLVGTN